MDATTLNTIGLILDAVGVILLFFFGLTKNISKTGSVNFVFQGKDENEIKKWKIYNFLSIIGFVFVVSGFTIQIISNYIKVSCL